MAGFFIFALVEWLVSVCSPEAPCRDSRFIFEWLTYQGSCHRGQSGQDCTCGVVGLSQRSLSSIRFALQTEAPCLGVTGESWADCLNL